MGVKREDDFADYIAKLDEQYHRMGFRETTKAHMTFKHIVHFLTGKNVGLGVYGEHGFESVHHDFSVHFENYKRDLDHPEFASKFLTAVKAYNCYHLAM